MTPKQEAALRLAREALKLNCSSQTESPATKAIAAIDEALAEQPAQQQEPVNKYCCHLCLNKSGQMFLDRMILCPECGNKRCPKATYHELPCTNSNEPGQTGSIYTSPQPSKPWVGLTDEQISNLWCEVTNTDFVTADTHEFARAIEAKLREKNTPQQSKGDA